jgi:hypothetical protein
MPRNPETHAKLSPVLRFEKTLPLESWVQEMGEKAKITDYACASYVPKKTT